MKKQSFSTTLGGKTLTVDITDLTERADGSVVLTYGETVVLVTAVMNEQPNQSVSFFPLSVEFEEKFYAAGAILGNRFQRREGRPSEEAVLSARIVDRTIRPLFNHAIRNDIQIVVTVLAMGEDDPDVLGVLGSSLALAISPIPWGGPVGAVRIGRTSNDREIVINPTYTQRAEGLLDFEVFVCGKERTINMIEVAAHEVPEIDLMKVLDSAIEIHTTLEIFQREIIAAVGKEKRAVPELVYPQALHQLFSDQYANVVRTTIFSNQAGKAHIAALENVFTEQASKQLVDMGPAVLKAFFNEQVDRILHEGAVYEGKRADGRSLDEIRPLFAQAGGVSPVLHGSGIFYRGGTHIFSALTLGGPNDTQIIDTIEEQSSSKRFMHHYNFPPFSVGETGRVGGFNRRMIGHGALAEKALLPVIPSKEAFPYTIRVVSETMASNGSSSMGAVCASTLALMDGGVPITRPVVGIASGVMLLGDEYALLTDIQGPEDEYGDMDLKVAGTDKGITAVQMDVKVHGISLPILHDALNKAFHARQTILTTIRGALATPRLDISPRAPHIAYTTIKPEQIGLVIGGGGKTINGIKDASGVDDISIEDDGSVYITGPKEAVEDALQRIISLTKVYELGERYDATITNLATFGAFASFDDGNAEGLIHISEIASRRIEAVESILSVGDVVPVVVIKNDNGKIGLSIKQAAPEFFS